MMSPVEHLDLNSDQHALVARHRVPFELSWRDEGASLKCIDRAMGYAWVLFLLGTIMVVLGFVMVLLRNAEPRAVLTTLGGAFVFGLGWRVCRDHYSCTLMRDSMRLCIERKTMKERLSEELEMDDARVRVRQADLRASHISMRYRSLWVVMIEGEKLWFVTAVVDTRERAEGIAHGVAHRLGVPLDTTEGLTLRGLAVL
ncbi:MAG: hypothetical protein KF912_00795 [Phycisphaeraceae bacterium]|nr:hypothetical protein [Phycisphaeraceae bacterium]MBX3365836.1 hypothetical protein [Phycisphaeraceae bacterium]